jgi:hypothetical protein
MSHFTEMEVSFDQKHEAQLIAALEEQFGKGNVEVHEKGAGLYGYQGDLRSKNAVTSANYAPECHIIIRRKSVGSASNDVGYRRNENGKYNAYISDYDKGSNFNKEKQGTVLKNYGVGVAEKNLKKQGWIVKKTQQKNGAILLEAEPGIGMGIGKK